jgi:hypothetical protein
MAVRPSRLPRDTRTILRAVVAPFIIGVAAVPGSVWLAAETVPRDMAAINESFRAIAFVMVAVVIGGTLAGAVSGRNHGWLGFVFATAGLAAGIVGVSLYAYGAALLDRLPSVLGYFGASWVVLTLGYALAQLLVDMIAGPRQEPARWGAAPPVAPWGPGPTWPTAPGQTDGGEDPKGAPQDRNQPDATR